MSAPYARHSVDPPVPTPRGECVSDPLIPSFADGTTLEFVYRTEAPRLARYFRSRAPHGDDPADLVQEAFARLAVFMSKSQISRPGAYLQRIARNLLYDRTKRLETRLSSLHRPIEEATGAYIAADQELIIEAQDSLRIYREALAELAPRTREVFLLHRVDDLTYREIAMKMTISIPTVQYHIARALAHIDAALDAE